MAGKGYNMATKKKSDITFEGAMARLDEITAALDGKQITLEQSLKLYAESMELIAYCKSCLEETERKISVIGQEGILETIKSEDK